jgi:hypothetical protein
MPDKDFDLSQIHDACSFLIGHRVKTTQVEESWFNRLSFLLVSKHLKDRNRFTKTVIGSTNSLWRLETESEVLAASLDKHAFILAQISKLDKETLLAIEVQKPVFEASFRFTGGLSLHFFPIHAKHKIHWVAHTFDKQRLLLGAGTDWRLKSLDN